VKIGPVDVEIIGMTEITTNLKINLKKTLAKHKPSSPALGAERVS